MFSSNSLVKLDQKRPIERNKSRSFDNWHSCSLVHMFQENKKSWWMGGELEEGGGLKVLKGLKETNSFGAMNLRSFHIYSGLGFVAYFPSCCKWFQTHMCIRKYNMYV